MKKPKILFYDIETSPNIAYTWGKWKQDVPAFLKERELLSIAYAWNDGPIRVATRQGCKSDKKLARFSGELLSRADVTIAHYGDKFDRKIIKTRMLKHKMKPLKHNCSVDTKSASSSYFGFNGNSLQDVCNYLGIGRKMPNPGISLWIECMANVSKSWSLMREYNKHDVFLLRELYKNLAPWIENHPNLAKLVNPASPKNVCIRCRSTNTIKNGLRATAGGVSQRMACLDCGKHYLVSINRNGK